MNATHEGLSKKYEVFTAVDGLSGLDIAHKEHPDIILLDLALPDIDGWEVARKIKTNIFSKEIPIIVVTAHTLAKDRERAFEAGCDAFFVKPFNVAKLISEIERLADR